MPPTTLSKYCRQSKVNLIDLSKRTNISMPKLNFIYTNSILEFEALLNKTYSKGIKNDRKS